ncbi:MAG: FAD:protein FMN transferase, partial [Acidimicrobiales bacterium]
QSLEVLRGAGVKSALLNAGGDLVALGRPSPDEVWRVGIRHPWRADALACVVQVDAAVATSGSYERGAHLIDPYTGEPARRAASATVTGPSLALADALATALAVGGDLVFGVVAGLDGYDAYLIRPDGTELSSAGMVFLS